MLIKTPKKANYRFGGQADRPARIYEYKPEVIRFAYKGLIIERRGSIYQIVPPKLRGFDMSLCDGTYTDARSLLNALNQAFESVDVERQGELRVLHVNYLCPYCKGATLIQKKDQRNSMTTCPLCEHHAHFSHFEQFKDDVLL